MKYTIVIIAVVSALFCRAFLVSVYKVPTQTMAPTILAGDFLLASQMSYGLRLPWSKEAYFEEAPLAGDLVVFTRDYRTYVKRVVAVERDEYEYSNGRLSVNGKPCDYDRLLTGRPDNDGEVSKFAEKCVHFTVPSVFIQTESPADKLSGRVPTGKFLVMGDNRIASESAEVAELIGADQIIGSPVLIWMSYSSTQDFISESLGVRWNRILTKVY